MIRSGPRWLVLVTVLAALLLAACSRNSDADSTATVVLPPTETSASPTATPPAAATGESTAAASAEVTASAPPDGDGPLAGAVVTIPELLAESADLTGETVLTHGYVDTVLSGRAVVLTDASEQLLVLGSDGALPEGLAADEFVEASGRVEPFDAERVAEELDISLSGVDVARFDGEPALIVDSARAGATPVGEVSANANAFGGRTIAVGGAVESAIDTRAFVLAPAGGPGEDGVLVVTAFPAIPGDMAEQARVQVVGQLMRLDTVTLERLGADYAFLADPAFGQWREGPLFVADVVDVVAPAPTASVESILAQPEAAQEQFVTVIDDVAARLTDRAMTIGPEGALMIVGTPEQLSAEVAEGATVLVTGTVKRFDPESPPDVAGFDPDHPALADYAGQPIIVVSAIEVLPGE